MIPAEKYMPKDKYRATDMNFVPFQNKNTTNTANTSTITGWIPVYFFNNNMPFDNIMTSLPFQNSNTNINMPTTPNMSTTPNMPTTPNMQLNQSSQNSLSDNQFPSNTDTDILYSYNKKSADTSDIISSPSKSITANKPRSSFDFDLNLIEALRNFDLDLEEDIDLVRNTSQNRDADNNKIEAIFKDIEKNYPGTFSLLQAYNVPYPIVKLMIRRVIKLTLSYCSKKEGI